MNMINVLKYNIKSIYTLKRLLVVFVVFLVVSLSSVLTIHSIQRQIHVQASLIEMILFTLGGLNSNYYTFLFEGKWLLIQATLAYLIGEFFEQELRYRCIYKISRIGSFISWIIANFITIIAATIIFYIIGYCTIIGTSISFGIIEFSSLDLIKGIFPSFVLEENMSVFIVTYVFYQLVLAAFTLLLFQTMQYIIFNSVTMSLISNIGLTIVAIHTMSLYPNIIKWIPGAQGMYFLTSYIIPEGIEPRFFLIYNFLIITILIGVLYRFVIKRTFIVKYNI